MGRVAWHEFSSGTGLAAALAGAVAGRLAQAIAERGSALLALSGGSTPKRFLAQLSHEPLDWSRVTVTLVDERFAAPTSPRSNARLLADNLLRNEAGAARFVGLYHAAGSAGEAAARAATEIASLPLPLDVAVLGMGMDGHTASFFPDADDAAAILAGNGPPVVAVHAPSAPEPRLMLSVPVLAGARFLALHIEGAPKRAVFEAAMREGDAPLPIRTLIERAAAGVDVFWAPQPDPGP